MTCPSSSYSKDWFWLAQLLSWQGRARAPRIMPHLETEMKLDFKVHGSAGQSGAAKCRKEFRGPGQQRKGDVLLYFFSKDIKS